ncbi:MAG: deoxyribonuclease IV [Planctomycetia bacterium]|nr:deoxyribonuclease IV [Planctomycetia bacterium]
MNPLGVHESISGGLHKAVEAAAAVGCDCVQIFTKNSNQWKGKALTDKEIDQFQAALEKWNISHPISHDSYLINLGSPDDILWNRSVAAMEEEMLRAEALGIPYVVMHPGSYTTSSENEGLERIIEGLQRVLEHTAGIQTRCLLENTAGQGTNLGWKFEHLATIIQGVEGVVKEAKLGVCFDTCHAFAAGYDFTTAEKYQDVFQKFHKIIGLERIRAFHLNDATKECGSRIDRHAHIGHGKIGTVPFGFFLNDVHFQSIPMYLETPKGFCETENGEEDWDVVNLRTLRELIRDIPAKE